MQNMPRGKRESAEEEVLDCSFRCLSVMPSSLNGLARASKPTRTVSLSSSHLSSKRAETAEEKSAPASTLFLAEEFESLWR